ncbi:MAG: hypothetical protein UX25_C0013G0009 [Candidatus Woesebacteria bacterium GW2011_GWC2_45_9]|uniref:Uncharacterized protein n=1 Tax=Candidatus Woesebacteria bacterium GW2011_GWC2_45_9 TaxID=1618589 RepID=A0A0G1N9R0_9BACT|nr:MAG: hypothetical protein UX25_C0013G0009 [Candidatus Woesebacteria bacterium GW2011_GWC2_45_9]
MDPQKARQISDYIFKDVFGVESPYSLKSLNKKFAIDIPSTHKVACALSGSDTWTISSKNERVASQKAVADRFKKDEWMKKTKPFRSIDDILAAWQDINYQVVEKYINSKETLESDGIYNSASVYRSVSIFDSKNVVFSYKLFDCNYMLASRDNSSCTLGIRMKESIFCSSGFEISWSNKVSRCMYIHDGFDLFECLFCSHIRSKKYCIANMQLDKDEYFKLKKIAVNWILED